MKKIIVGLVLVLSLVRSWSASPSYDSFDKTQFHSVPGDLIKFIGFAYINTNGTVVIVTNIYIQNTVISNATIGNFLGQTNYISKFIPDNHSLGQSRIYDPGASNGPVTITGDSGANGEGITTSGWYSTTNVANGPVNVKAFGATGDGSDQTSEVQAGLDALNVAGGGTLMFPQGIYLVDSLTGYANVSLIGIPGKSILWQALGAQYVYSVNPYNGGTTSVTGNATNIVIQGITFQGRAVSGGFSEQKHLLNLNAVSGVQVVNCRFLGSQGDGIYVGSGNQPNIERHNQDVRIQDCMFDGQNYANRNAISVVDCDGITVKGCSFYRYSANNMPGPIDVEPDNPWNVARNVLVTDCRFSACQGFSGITYYGVNTNLVTQMQGFVVRDCSFLADNIFPDGAVTIIATTQVVDSTQPHGIVISGNQFNQPGYGLDLRGTVGAIIQGNTFLGTGPIYISEHNAPTNYCKSTVFSGNTLRFTGNSQGMLNFGTMTNLTISDNLFDTPLSTNASGFIYFQGGTNGATFSEHVALERNTFLKGSNTSTNTFKTVVYSGHGTTTGNTMKNNKSDGGFGTDFQYDYREDFDGVDRMTLVNSMTNTSATALQVFNNGANTSGNSYALYVDKAAGTGGTGIGIRVSAHGGTDNVGLQVLGGRTALLETYVTGNLGVETNLTVKGECDVQTANGYKANGVPGITTIFSWIGSGTNTITTNYTMTVTAGLVTSVVHSP